MIVLGIDPGLGSTGFGAISCSHSAASMLKCGYIRTSPSERVPSRLFQIHSDVTHLIQAVRPDLMAVENVFSLVRYPRAGILLGGVLGVVCLSAFENNVPMVEISPREVKNSLVGHGAADKYQIKKAVKKLLRVDGITSLHASDALAIALTAFYRGSDNVAHHLR